MMIRRIVILAALVLAAVSAVIYRFAPGSHRQIQMSPTTGDLDVMIFVTLVLIAAFIAYIVYRQTHSDGGNGDTGTQE